MPFGWTRMNSSPPRARRGEVHQICAQNHARLCENETFYDNGADYCWALIQIDVGGKTDVGKLRDELESTEWKALVSADEKEDGKSP